MKKPALAGSRLPHPGADPVPRGFNFSRVPTPLATFTIRITSTDKPKDAAHFGDPTTRIQALTDRMDDGSIGGQYAVLLANRQ